jgi:hypothetical protein
MYSTQLINGLEYTPIWTAVWPFKGCVVVVKGFFDGSKGRAKVGDEEFLSLACIAAPLETGAWGSFEEAWGKVLGEYDAPYLHMKDLYQFVGPFSKDKGWCEVRRAAFLSDLLRGFYGLVAQPQVCTRATTVSLTDHARAVASHPGILPSPECLCTFWCFSEICGFYSDDRFALVFDRGEPFFHTINRVWERRRKADGDARLQRITALGQGEMRRYRPLQAADLFAWEMNRLWTRTHLRAPSTLRAFIEEMSSVPTIPVPDKLEGEGMLLVTQSKRWEYADFEHLAQGTRARSDFYSLCPKVKGNSPDGAGVSSRTGTADKAERRATLGRNRNDA